MMSKSIEMDQKAKRMAGEYANALYGLGYTPEQIGRILLYGGLCFLSLNKNVTTQAELDEDINGAILALKIRKVCS